MKALNDELRRRIVDCVTLEEYQVINPMFSFTTDALAEHETALSAQDAGAAAAPLAQPQAAAPLAAAPATPGIPLTPVMGVASGIPPAAGRGPSPGSPPPPPWGSQSRRAGAAAAANAHAHNAASGTSGALRRDPPTVRTRDSGAGSILGCQCGAPTGRCGARRGRVRGSHCRQCQAGCCTRRCARRCARHSARRCARCCATGC